MAKTTTTTAITLRDNCPNEQFMIAVSHDIKEVIVRLIDLIEKLAAPASINTK